MSDLCNTMDRAKIRLCLTQGRISNIEAFVSELYFTVFVQGQQCSCPQSSHIIGKSKRDHSTLKLRPTFLESHFLTKDQQTIHKPKWHKKHQRRAPRECNNSSDQKTEATQASKKWVSSALSRRNSRTMTTKARIQMRTW